MKNKSIEKKREIGNILFFISYGIFLLFEILGTSLYYHYLDGIAFWIIRFVWVSLLFIREFFIAEEYGIPKLIRLLIHNIKWLVVMVVLVIFVLFNTIVTHDLTVLFILIFLFCARNIDFKQIARFSFLITLCTVVLIMVSGYVGIIENYTLQETTRVRQYLGFRYALYAPMYLFNLTALYLYIRNKHVTWIELAIMVWVDIWMFLQTDSRLAFFLILILILVFAFLKIKPDFMKGKRVLGGILTFSFVICFVISLILVLGYSSSVPITESVNSMLEGRLDYAKTSILNNGIPLFGQRLNMVGFGLDANGNLETGSYFYIDCLYIQFLQRNGVLMTAIWLAFLTLTMYFLYRTGRYYVMVCLVVIAIGLMVDDLLIRLYFNTFWFAGSWILTRFLYQSKTDPKLIPGEESRTAKRINRIFSWKAIEENR